jgi:hypothetical protein
MAALICRADRSHLILRLTFYERPSVPLANSSESAPLNAAPFDFPLRVTPSVLAPEHRLRQASPQFLLLRSPLEFGHELVRVLRFRIALGILSLR